jgi:hypothetical protein
MYSVRRCADFLEDSVRIHLVTVALVGKGGEEAEHVTTQYVVH